MIGRAIHQILKTNISELSTGGIYPIIMPQNPKYTLGTSTSYPAIIYDIILDYETSKQSVPNIKKASLSINVISDTYIDVDNVSTQVRDVLDKYQDLSKEGINDVKGYTDPNSNPHNFSANIDINNIFYKEDQDDYIDDLFLYTRSTIYDVFYYDNLCCLSYDNDPITNPLMLNLDFTLQTNEYSSSEYKGALLSTTTISGDYPITGSSNIKRAYNKIGGYYAKETPTSSKTKYDSFFTTENSTKPSYITKQINTAYGDGALLFSDSAGFQYIRAYDGGYKNISLPYGALFIYVYKPLGVSGYLSGNHTDTSGGDIGNMVINHELTGGTLVNLKFNPCGNFTDFSSRTNNLIVSSDKEKYWDANFHFLALSVGGNKAQTGGSYNQSGWYEYFNSDYNPKLTTGQIIKNNSFTGNSDTYAESLTFAGIGNSIDVTSGMFVFEMMLFVPTETTSRGGGDFDSDSAPFQPTDIIYKNIKDYVYNRYSKLK